MDIERSKRELLLPVADTTDPVDMTTELPDGTILANMLTDDGDTSEYDRRTDSLEAIANALVEAKAVPLTIHTVFRTEDELALKNTNLDIFDLDAIGGTCRNVVVEVYMEKGTGGQVFTPVIKKTDELRPTTYTSQLIPALATVATPATDGRYRYEVGDVAEDQRMIFNLAQDNAGDANIDIVAVMTYER